MLQKKALHSPDGILSAMLCRKRGGGTLWRPVALRNLTNTFQLRFHVRMRTHAGCLIANDKEHAAQAKTSRGLASFGAGGTEAVLVSCAKLPCPLAWSLDLNLPDTMNSARAHV